jgi:hypothetical protein
MDTIETPRILLWKIYNVTMGLWSNNGVHTRHQQLHLIACSKVSINYDDFGSKNNNEVETSFVDLLNGIPKLGTLLDKTNKNITKHVVWIESLNYKKCQA